MAFCPHCGSSITEQASQCAACGQSLATVAAAKPKGRFKGTMMAMGGRAPANLAAGGTAPTADSAASPASGDAPPANKMQPPAPPPLGSATSAALVGNAVATPAKKKHGTMLGVGALGVVPAAAPDPAPVEAAAADPLPPTPQAPTPVSPPKTSSAARSGSGQALARNPAAQTDGRSLEVAARGAARAPGQGRFMAGSIPPAAPGPGLGKVVGLGIGGMVLIAAAGYAIAMFLGLVH